MDDVARLNLPEPRGALETDQLFDSCLPPKARARADQYWTPLAVAGRAAALFRRHGGSSVLDVGCGPGKFCIAAGCAEPGLQLTGVEQRVNLVHTARRLARRFQLKNVRFSLADALEVSWNQFDGFYFFNPFVENLFSRAARFDDTVGLSMLRFAGT